MIRLVIAYTFVALTVAGTVLDPDADYQEWKGRIVGGQTATPGQFPYQVSLRSAANSHFCGGFLISTRWIGSAAHCTINRSAGNVLVVVGAQHRVTGGTTYSVSRIVNHPNYSAQTLLNDISVIQTTNDVIEKETVRKIALGSEFVTAGHAIASGWGQTSHPGSAAAELQFVQVDVISNESCRSRLSASQASRIFDSTICTSSPINVGMCMGDSGGPLSQGGTVIGAVSWGIACARGSPDMFARISSQRSWIESVIA